MEKSQSEAGIQSARTKTLVVELYQSHRDRLRSIARRNSLTAADADDALQEAFICFIQAFDPRTGSPPLPWLILTLKRQCWSIARRSGRQSPVVSRRRHRFSGSEDPVAEPRDPSRGPEELAEVADQVAAAGNHLAALKPDQRQALTLLAFGYSYQEISEITGWTRTKVNRCLVEGRSHLREATDPSGTA